jgi:hypothetical protein
MTTVDSIKCFPLNLNYSHQDENLLNLISNMSFFFTAEANKNKNSQFTYHSTFLGKVKKCQRYKKNFTLQMEEMLRENIEEGVDK